MIRITKITITAMLLGCGPDIATTAEGFGDTGPDQPDLCCPVLQDGSVDGCACRSAADQACDPDNEAEGWCQPGEEPQQVGDAWGCPSLGGQCDGLRSGPGDMVAQLNDRGEISITDGLGKPISGDVRVNYPYIIHMLDESWVTVDGHRVESGEPTEHFGDVGIGCSIPFRCSCVDSNGIPWTQDCDEDVSCADCCSTHGGSHPRLTITPPDAGYP